MAGVSAAAAGGAYGKLPLAFEPNRGQSDGKVRFLARGAGYGLFLTAGEAVLSLKPTRAGGDAARLLGGGSSGALGAGMSAFGAKRGTVLRFGLVGANPAAKITGSQRLPGQSNYMVGNDPRRWQTAIPNYAKVRYSSVYPGTDLVYYGRQGQLEYDFVLAPGADPDRIAFSVAGAQGVTIDQRGDLMLRTAAGDVVQRRPVVYQRVGSQRRRVRGRYVLTGRDRVGFRVGGYDRSRPLVIDPVISYSTYLGGSGHDAGSGIAVDPSGIYVTGLTGSTADFPKQTPAQSTSGGDSDAFVTKLNAAGSALVYSTYLGGTDLDEAAAVAVDGSGNAYVTGTTISSNFPTAPTAPGGVPVQPRRAGTGNNNDAFVAKLTNAGSLAYSTYLGGAGAERGHDIAVDSASPPNAYVTGSTASGSLVPAPFVAFPTKNAVQATYGGASATYLVGDAFVSKLTFSGQGPTDLVYSTYLGGSSDDAGHAITVDAASPPNTYVTGYTYSTNFPSCAAGAPSPCANGTAGPLQSSNAGETDAFLSKLNGAGSALSYSTYLGGSRRDQAHGIAVKPNCASGCEAYVTGQAESSFPTGSPLPGGGAYGGGNTDAFVSKLNDVGSALVSSTYLGGGGTDTGYGVAVDSSGSAYVTGDTYSSNFPQSNAVQAAKGASSDAFVSKLTGSGPALSSLAYSTYLGGSAGTPTAGDDHGHDIAVDPAGSAFVTGSTPSTNFPISSAGSLPPAPPYQSARAGTSTDAFVSKISLGADVSITKTAAPDPVNVDKPLTYTLSVSNAGPDVAKGVSVSDQLPTGVALVAASSGCSQSSPGTVTCSVGDLASGDSREPTITVRPSATGSLQNTATAASQTFDPVGANNSSTTETAVVPATIAEADVSITKTDSPDPVQTGQDLTYTLTAKNVGPDDAQSVVLQDQLPSGVVFVAGSSSPECSQPAGSTVVTCTVGALGSGDPGVSRQIVVRPTAPNPSLSNTATVHSSTGDPFSSNNTVTESTVVRAVADVSVAKSDSPDPVVAGEQLTYTLTAKNSGADVAPGVVISDALPDGVQFVSASGCSLTGAVVSCDVGDLAGGGATAQRRIVVRPTEANPALANTASVHSAAIDSDNTNNSQTATTEVREAPAPPPPDGGTTPPSGGPGGSGAMTPLAPGLFAPPAPLLPSAPPAPAALVAISDQSISPRRFAAAPSGPSALAAQRKRPKKPVRTGARVSYRLNMAGSVRFTISQNARGRLQGKGKTARCVAQTKQNRRARACRRTVTLAGSFVLSGKAGPNSFSFTGRLANRKLRPGSYTLTATATANGRTGKPASVSFTITR